MSHTKRNIVELAENHMFAYMYQMPWVNYSGKTKDTGEYFTEIVAKTLLKSDFTQQHIPAFIRNNYRISSHQDQTISPAGSKRAEEIKAKGLVAIDFEVLGRILDFQIPLKGKQSDNAGKVDLIAHNQKKGTVTLVELKYGNNKETLLRAGLEIWTYYHQLNKEAFLRSYGELKGLTADNIRKAVLFGSGTRAHKEALDIGNRPQLRKLLIKMGVTVFLLEKQDVLREVAF